MGRIVVLGPGAALGGLLFFGRRPRSGAGASLSSTAAAFGSSTASSISAGFLAAQKTQYDPRSSSPQEMSSLH